MHMEDVYAVILAGGSGTRFWPKSRHLTPKQLCKIGQSEETMLEATLSRLDGFIPPERRIIVTHHEQAPKTKKLVGNRVAKVLAEPEARNTASALALASIEIEQVAPQAVMISLHADSLVQDLAAFQADLTLAAAVARKGHLTLLGVKPRYAETGYGYIEKAEKLNGFASDAVYAVASFREKPEKDLAETYLASGRFFWNSGLFVWQVAVILEELEEYLPQVVPTLKALLREQGVRSFGDLDCAVLGKVYSQLPKVAIDHAVLEKSKRVAVVATDFGWADIGSWDALAQVFPTDGDGNYRVGNSFLVDCQNVTVDSDGPFIAAIGLHDLVVVAAGGAVLVCPSERAQEVKKVVEHLRETGRLDLL